jgi:cytochrome b561
MKHAPTKTYSTAQKRLHWSVVILLAVQYLFLDNMGRLFHQTVDTGSPVWTTTSTLHALIGVALLLLALARLVLRLRTGTPPPVGGPEPDWSETAANVTHFMLYALLIGIPLDGLAAWFLGNKPFAQAHEIGTTVLLWMVGLHVAAVVVHQFWWKSPILKRML